MSDLWPTIVNEMGEHTTGPLSLRPLIQPTVAGIPTVRDDRRDAREGRPPFGWSVLRDAAHRAYSLQSSWKTIGRVVLLVVALDLVHLLFIYHAFLPRQSVALALLLALILYLFFRGVTTRVATLMRCPA